MRGKIECRKQIMYYATSRQHLTRNPAGWYKTNLPWKANHPDLATNEAASRRRLMYLVKKLKQDGNYEQYKGVIREQLEQGIIEEDQTNL